MIDRLINVIVVFLLVFYTATVFADDKSCKKKVVETTNLSYVMQQTISRDFSVLLNNTIGEIEDVASQLSLKEFEIISTDIAASRNYYPGMPSDGNEQEGYNEMIDFTVSVTLRFIQNDQAFTRLLQQTMPVSVYSSIQKVCGT